MKNILNLTQHTASEDQTAEGVFDLEGEKLSALKSLLTFDAAPTADVIVGRASAIAAIAVDSDCKIAMIGGAPFLMSSLERELKKLEIEVVYAFSLRESVDEIVGGKTLKRTVFAHKDFVQAVHDS